MRRKGSAISVVILAFAMLIYVLIPLGKALFELVYFHHIRERALAMTESAVYSLATDLDPFLYSEAKIRVINERLKDYLVDEAGIIVPEQVRCTSEEGVMHVHFIFDYPAAFTGLKKTMDVTKTYHLERIERPVHIP